MSSTNKTPNLQLNQWEGNDFPKWADRNNDNLKIDAAIGKPSMLITVHKSNLVEAINEAALGSEHAPYIGANGNWHIWDETSGQFMDSGVAAQGPEGQIGPKGNVGDTGPKGDTGEQGVQGPKGDTGDKGDTGAQGPQGDPGAGLQILGTYATLEDLYSYVQSANQGDMYNVGTEPPYEIYMFEQMYLEFIPLGQLQGPQGEKGDKGDKGDPGEQGIQGIQGPKGDQGDTGDQGLKGDTGPGVPTGGTVGQLLKKSDATDFATSWTSISASDVGAAAATHAHGALTNDGKIGTASGKILTTGADGAVQAQSIVDAGLTAAPGGVTATGAITVTVANNTEYAYTAVTSLNMTGAAVNSHGFITFTAATPTINVSGFTAAGGDDITDAAASEVWEFSVYAHNSGSYIVWKNWGAPA